MIVLDNKICLRKPDLKDIDALYEIKNDKKAATLLGGFSNGYSKMDIENWIILHNSKKEEVLYWLKQLGTRKLLDMLVSMILISGWEKLNLLS